MAHGWIKKNRKNSKREKNILKERTSEKKSFINHKEKNVFVLEFFYTTKEKNDNDSAETKMCIPVLAVKSFL